MNHLSTETSPYLLQHADNPVDWHPWGPQALERARSEGKPILLSIGYSACHWCHVMAHESFENAETAALMNELYVNIKVDREERPDLDRIYQVAHQVLTQRPGGWPLTMFLSPQDQTPFFGGTYFPPAPRHGLPAFSEILRRVAQYYGEHGAEIAKQNAALRDVFGRLSPEPASATAELTAAPLAATRAALEAEFDPQHGGFGGAPKFPHAPGIEVLLRSWQRSRHDGAPDERALHMATFSLQCMARGGIYDQLGGGFCRYSVDAQWQIPHFEKMLYDNGPLLALCAQAWQATGEALFERVTRETADWCIRDMQSPEGGYYATLDADSEGKEGRFYVWDREEVRQIVGDQAFDLVTRHFGLDGPPNFEGGWHLRVVQPLTVISREGGRPVEELRGIVDAARAKLFEVRSRRVWPGRDEKILTGWNGLMIRGMAIAARALEEPAFAESATRALGFIRRELWHDGRLLASCKDGRAQLPAYLDDYAYLIDGLIELAQAGFSSDALNFAVELAEGVLAHFEDKKAGGFFFTADDHERLIHRPKPLGDDATPSGNGIAARAMLRLGYLLGETRYLEAAERTLRTGWEAMRRYPSGHATLTTALEEYLHPVETVILRGDAFALAAWRDALTDYAPHRLVFSIPPEVADLPSGLAARSARDAPVAYVCRGTACTAPISSIVALEKALGTRPGAQRLSSSG
ncbi:MAG: thioredoxin domain-containing protein [Gammaproteobacteria bacterium]